ncbi:MAG: ATP-dependent RNA helicase DeaD [Alteromonadaceae bacterium]|jgi:ATP-dependent RNA helicase DeaD
MTTPVTVTFADLNLSPETLKAVGELGYESPSPIQAATIPLILNNQDIIGQAQTGTGKTGAFALPVLSQIDLEQRLPQVIVMCPTRELAIQVSEAFQAYARYIKGFHVLPIYGGQAYGQQISALKRGVHVVVGTPGRVLDHLNKGTLKLTGIKTLILDEADEMLRMGFIEDIETIMDAAPSDCQKTMFSATMPAPIAKIARKYLRNPQEVKIASKTSTVERIDQQFLMLRNNQKLDALTRILEAEEYEGCIIFVRTRSLTTELSEKLEARGHAVSPINGDMNQAAREQTIRRLKSGQLDIVIATDVAARGLDVERITLVINYDIPLDTEAYVHRVGRTGRAGRTGKAILLTTPREKRLLFAIERATNQKLTSMPVPSSEMIAQRRADNFSAQVAEVMSANPLQFYQEFSAKLQEQLEVSESELAAALIFMAQERNPLQVDAEDFQSMDVYRNERDERGGGRDDRGGRERDRGDRGGERGGERGGRDRQRDDSNKQTYRLEVGREHGVQVSDIVGAIANEARINAKEIGRIKLNDNFSTVDLPKGLEASVLDHLRKVQIRKRQIDITAVEGGHGGGEQKRSSRGRSDGARSGGGGGRSDGARSGSGSRDNSSSRSDRPKGRRSE